MKRPRTVVALSIVAVALGACGQAPNDTGCSVPSDVPIEGALLWLQADCGVQSGSDGEVRDWASIVGSLHATPSATFRQPALESDGLAGHAAIRFDGSFDRLDVDLNIHPATYPELTVVTVFASDVEDPAILRKLYGADDGDYDRTVGLDPRAPNGMNYTIFGGQSEVEGYFTLSAETPYLTVDSFRSGFFDGWVNGAETVAGIEVIYGEGLPKFYLGGTGTVFLEPWEGTIAEMLVYGRSLTSEERMEVEDYLAAKYQLTLSR